MMRARFALALTLILALALAQPVAAFTGNTLLMGCKLYIAAAEDSSKKVTATDMYDIGFCQGILYGMASLGGLYQVRLKEAPIGEGAVFCPPDGGTTLQDARVMIKYLQEHPERLHGDAHLLALLAFTEAYPCF